MERILIVDDDEALRLELAEALQDAAFEVVEAASIAECRRQYAARAPTVVLLDMGLPDGPGTEITRELRRVSDIPILFLSGRNDEIDRILGLELGADDFIGKPCSPRELIARINAVLRRARYVAPPARERTGQLAFRGFVLDPASRELFAPGGAPIALTMAEFDLLAVFVATPQHVLSRDRLLDALRGADWAGYHRTIDGLVSRLRRKIASDDGHPPVIRTVRGVGYMFCTPVSGGPPPKETFP